MFAKKHVILCCIKQLRLYCQLQYLLAGLSGGRSWGRCWDNSAFQRDWSCGVFFLLGSNGLVFVLCVFGVLLVVLCFVGCILVCDFWSVFFMRFQHVSGATTARTTTKRKKEKKERSRLTGRIHKEVGLAHGFQFQNGLYCIIYLGLDPYSLYLSRDPVFLL